MGALLVSGSIAGGCGTAIPPGQSFTAEIDRGVDPPATMSVVVEDQPHVLLTVEPVALAVDDEFIRSNDALLRPDTLTLANPPDDPTQVIAFWLGGACDDRATMVLSGGSGTMRLDTTIDARCVDGSTWMHAVALHFGTDMPAANVTGRFSRAIDDSSAS